MENPPVIPFNKPHFTGRELDYIAVALAKGQLAGDGSFTRLCQARLAAMTGTAAAFLTHSCTAALEMAAILLDLGPGDEVIMPSFTFVSTANAVVLRGAVPVFVDIRPDTLNLDEMLIEDAITPRTKGIFAVHYAGIACDMDMILHIADKHGLKVVEDAAQGVMASYKGRALGSLGDIGAFSFHETKNIISGEGGAILVNNGSLVQRAEIIREKGTDRSRYFRGEVDKYTWQDTGSSYLPGELTAAFLLAQLEDAEAITQKRISVWNACHERLAPLEQAGLIRRPSVPEGCIHNGHLYYVILDEGLDRDAILPQLKNRGVHCVFHYVPLHSAEAGRTFGRPHGDLAVTDDLSGRLVRLPLWHGMTTADIDTVTETLGTVLRQSQPRPLRAGAGSL